MYTQQPACEFTLVTTPKVWYTHRSPTPQYLNLPQYEVQVSEDFLFYIQKCDLSQVQTDPECFNAPFDYTMQILFEVQAVNDQGIIVDTNTEVTIDINFINPCGADGLDFNNPIQDFTYYIDQTAAPVAKDPFLVQLYPQCLRECYLTEQG